MRYDPLNWSHPHFWPGVSPVEKRCLGWGGRLLSQCGPPRDKRKTMRMQRTRQCSGSTGTGNALEIARSGHMTARASGCG
jgi:hypothetical protein